MLLQRGRQRVRKCADDGRIRGRVDKRREVGREQIVRLPDRNREVQDITCTGRSRGRDPILAQPVHHRVRALRCGGDELFYLSTIAWDVSNSQSSL